MHSTRLAVLSCLCLVLTGSTLADPPGDDLLRGPEVAEEEATPSLVERSFDGMLIDVGPDVERAAIERLKLSDLQQEAFEKAMGERAAAFDAIVRGQYGEISKLGGLRDQPAEFLKLVGEIAVAFKPWVERGTALDEMREHLTDKQIKQVEAMVAEYRNAQRIELERDHPDRRELRTAIIRLRLEVFGALVTESIQRQVGFARAQFERFAEELELTPEQKTKAQTIYGPVTVAEFQGKATDAQRRAAFTEFFRLLNADQRMKLLSLLARDYQPKRSDGKGSDEGASNGMDR